jgi:hypothetical protein
MSSKFSSITDLRLIFSLNSKADLKNTISPTGVILSDGGSTNSYY